MSHRRLSLRRETLSVLQPDELGSVVGAISAPNLLCAVLSIQWSHCHSCGFGCSYDCPTTDCPTG